jgi:superfamily I DNA/RNA helicase
MAISVRTNEPPRTKGEELVQQFISTHLPESFSAWMNVELSVTGAARGDVHQMELDIVLFHQELGLILGEVKDWRANQLSQISQQSVLFENGRQESNPSAALKKKFYAIQSKLASREEFSAGKRRVRFPISFFVCLPYIRRCDWQDLFDRWNVHADDVGLPAPIVLFADDFSGGSELADPAKVVQRLDLARSVRFPVTLSSKQVPLLDTVFRGCVSSPSPEIAVLKGSEIINSVVNTWKRGGRSQQGAQLLREIISDASRRAPELLQLRNTVDNRLQNCVVYQVNSVTSLVTIHHEGVIYPLFCGTPAEASAWIEKNESLVIAIDRATSRLALTHSVSDEAQPYVSNDLAITSTNTPLFQRLPNVSLEELGLRSLEVRYLQGIDEHTSPEEIEELLNCLEDPLVAKLLANMATLLRKGRTEEAQASFNLFKEQAVDASRDPILESEALHNQVNSDIACLIDDLSPESVKAMFAPEGFQEWMLFLHPKQQEIVDCDTERPLLITGISGSGKTCILVHRARRLAAMHPERKICLLTLNRPLAALLDQLVTALCTPGERERISVWAYYDLFRRILSRVGAQAYLDAYAETLLEGDRMHDTLRQVDARRCVNDFDPRSREDLNDTWSDFWWRCHHHEEPQLKEARARLFKYLREQHLTIDPEGYLREEFQLIRTAFPIEARTKLYGEFTREGRAIRLINTANHPHRRDVLYLLKRYEEYMLHGAMLDEEGVSQILMCQPLRESLRDLPPEVTFDHLLIDEFQDFSSVELNLLRQLPRADSNAFCAAGDSTQKILVKDLRMMAAGLVSGSAEIYRIRQNFRNSRQILQAASKLNSHYGEIAQQQGVDIEIIDPELAARETARPIACIADYQIPVAWEFAQEWVAEQEVAPWSVCIATAAPRNITVDSILEGRPEGLHADSIKGDYMSRPSHMVVGTISEVKGFEFSMIIIVGCSASSFPPPQHPKAEEWRDALRLYVAMTRGRDQVVLIYQDEPSECLELMRDSMEWNSREAKHTRRQGSSPSTVSEKPFKAGPRPTRAMTECPECGCQIREDRLAKHLKQKHP